MNQYDTAALEKAAQVPQQFQGALGRGPIQLTTKQRYQMQLVDAKERVRKLERLLELLDNNPDHSEMMDLMGGV